MATGELGPLGGLLGTWEGDKGVDKSPDDDPREVEVNRYRERMVFEETGLVENHSQKLYGLRYSTTAWRVGEPDPFHEDRGYWLWDAANEQVMRCFIVPRGVSIIAGGTAKADATAFELAADVGSETYGICSNRFLDAEFKTVRYELKVEINGNEWKYSQDTQMKIKGQDEIFHHTDDHVLRRV